MGANEKSQTASEIKRWLMEELASRLGLEPEEIDPKEPFTAFGLDSAEAIMLSGDLGEWLQREISPTIFWDYPCIEELAASLVSKGSTSMQQSAVYSSKHAANEPVAIVGIGCRFPHADGTQAFWELLCQGREAISHFPEERKELLQLQGAHPGMRGGGYLRDIDLFDAAFFKISHREAVRMDPQQRLLLEVIWEAFEDAGIVAEKLSGSKTGVFIGISNSDYGRNLIANTDQPHIYAVTGSALSIAANRISYLFNFQGPSLAIDTACSSSLVAVHYACQSLWQGESELAIAGGANLILSPEITCGLANAGMLASDNRCKTFDAEADGYVRGEGAGVVILKPLSQALQDGDDIYAVIHGSAVNQDGRTNGLTAPNQHSQEQVLREAYRRAGISPGAVHYIEAHGTGTYLGDPIEMKALGSVLAEDRKDGDICLVGSVKTNIGHLESAAGIAGLIKVALSIKNKLIPPHLHFHEPNPNIPFADLPFQIPATLHSWPDENHLIAGVSSFGFGGTNAHVVLGSGPVKDNGWFDRQEDLPADDVLIPLSAKTKESLIAYVEKMREFLLHSSPCEERLEDIAHTLLRRRVHHEYRLAVIGKDKAEAAMKLELFALSNDIRGVKHEQKTLFIFPGTMPFWWGNESCWILQDPVFRKTLMTADSLVRKQMGFSVWSQLFQEKNKAIMDDTQKISAALLSVQAALTDVWRSWGITPAEAVGFGVGVMSAAYAEQKLSLEEAFDRLLSSHEAAPDYAAKRIVEWADNGYVTLEISPEPVMDGSMLRSSCTDRSLMLESLGQLYTNGYSIEAMTVDRGEKRHVHLPQTAWQKKRCWLSFEHKEQ